MTRGGASNVYLSRPQPEVATEPSCSGTIECALAGAADHFLLLAWLLLMIVVAISSLVFLPRARDLCDRERRRTRAEYDAFDRFIEEMRDISPSNASQSVAVQESAPLLHRSATASAGGLEDIKTTYEDTVMAVPHYEEEYAEPIAVHMREELSEEIAEAVLNGSTLGHQLKRSILDAAVAARERRATFLEMLDEEANSLARHERELADVAEGVEEATMPLCADQSFDALREQREELEAYEARIQRQVNQRQADRNDGRIGAIRNGKSLDLQEYLYQPMEPTYPVLGESTRLLSRINVALRRIEDELIYRG